MKTARQYIDDKREELLVRKGGFEVLSPREPLSTKQGAVIAHLKSLSKLPAPEDLEHQILGDVRLYQHTERTLHADLYDCVGGSLHPLVDRVALGFVPTGLVNAMVTASDDDGSPLDGYAILVNNGIYWTCGRLAEAVIYENASPYYRDGCEAFRIAYSAMTEPSTDKFRNAMNRDLDDREIDAAALAKIESHVGAFMSIMLTFVALHELGHIALEHTKAGIPRYAVADRKYVSPETRKDHAALGEEYEADLFALDGLWLRGKNPDTAWRNMAAIESLLRLFHYAEQAGQRCPRHPPALRRAGVLKRRLFQHTGRRVTEHSAWLADRMPKWMEAVAK